MNDFVNDRPDVRYIKCATETALIEKFLEFWLDYNPDIITGWNVKFFDIPFLMNRFRRLMGDEFILQFSPWGVVSQQSARITAKGFNKEQNYWDIMGVSVLDYLDLYRKHTFVRRESYKLDYIGEVELGENKHENPYDTFKEFYQKDQEDITKRIKDLGLQDDLINHKGLTPGMLVTLGEQKILKLEDFADLASDELTGGYDVVKGERIKIQGYLEDFALSKVEADELIMSARNIVYKD